MSQQNVRTVRLESMLVASASGYGQTPETIAWEKLLTWAESYAALEQISAIRYFGFNNPNPSPGSPNYGYEQWMTVPPGTKGDENITIKEFSGGLYAVLACESLADIGERWQQLVSWREESLFHQAHHQWLEQLLSDPSDPHEQYVFDLYLPIAD